MVMDYVFATILIAAALIVPAVIIIKAVKESKEEN